MPRYLAWIERSEMISSPKNAPTSPGLRSISIALLTFRRTDELRRAVESVLANALPKPDSGWLLNEIIVIDNNPDGLAKPVVDALKAQNQAQSPAEIRYVHEGAAGIVAGRNRALDEARGDVLVFIDDDEIALPGWPHGLLQVMADSGAAMVGGPVLFEFTEEPPDWVVESGLFARATHSDGAELHWLRTGNVAIDLSKIRQVGLRFDPRFPHGEDATFSMQAVKHGLTLRWSTSASVMEYVHPDRTTVEWRRNRERISTDAWVRAELDIDRSPGRKLLVVARSAVRAVQGAFDVVVGTATSREATKNTGLARLSQTRGAIAGLVTHVREVGLR